MKAYFNFIALLFSFFIFNHLTAQNFTETAASLRINLGSNKSGGQAWADINNDGCLDLLVNTDLTTGSKLYLSNCDPNPDNITFTDITATHAMGISRNPGDRMERSTVFGDYNNDGYVDFARNGNTIIEIYLNKGPLATPPYSFGDLNQDANFTLTNGTLGGMNAEGLAWADVDGDGWLDLIFDNHGNGSEVLFKNTTGLDPCSDGFNLVEGNSIGLLNSTGDGDYIAVGDLNDDGYPDLLDRTRDAGRDLFINNGDGTFTLNNNLGETANNGNKGGVMMCDLDNDGDLDIFWTDAGRNVIYENLGGNPINFTVRPEGAALGINPTDGIDGCACGDVDNDGDEDIFLASNSGMNYLYRNDLNNGNAFFFIQDNAGIGMVGGSPLNENAEGCVIVDYDNDGDLDISVNIRGDNNQLWRSDLITTSTAEADRDYLKVKIVIQNPASASSQVLGRYAIGAQATLRRLPADGGAMVGAVKEVNGGRGHGAQDPAILHFGLPDGAEISYELTVKYPTMNGFRREIVTQIRPADLADRTLVIATSADQLGVVACNNLVALPIRLLEFKAKQEESAIQLNWSTALEENNSFFALERSQDGRHFEAIARVEGAGNSSSIQNYQYLDQNPFRGINYYRLKQTDFDGTQTTSNVIAISYDVTSAFEIYPNPSSGEFFIKTNTLDPTANIQILNNQGVLLKEISNSDIENATLQVKETLNPGIYHVYFQHKTGREVRKLVIN